MDAFLQHSNAVISHDVEAQLSRITAPTQITYGRNDRLTFDQFAERLQRNIQGSELVVFEGCAHAQIYDKVDEFNQKTLAFLRRHSG